MKKEIRDMNSSEEEFVNISLYNKFVSFHNGNLKSRNEIIVENMFLVDNYIKRMNIENMDNKPEIDDLYSVGYIGLIKAVDSYDISSDVPFYAFAHNCIRNEISDYLRKINRKKYNVQIIEEESYDIQENYEDKELLFRFYDFFDELGDDCKMALRLHYGFCGNPEHIIKDVAKEMDITYGQARHLVDKGVIKLRKMLTEEGFDRGISSDIQQYCKKYS